MTWQTKVVRVTLALGLLAGFAMAAGAGWVDGFGWIWSWF